MALISDPLLSDGTKTAAHITGIIRGFLIGQEQAGISREQAGINFMEFISEYGAGKEDNLIEAFQLLKKIL